MSNGHTMTASDKSAFDAEYAKDGGYCQCGEFVHAFEGCGCSKCKTEASSIKYIASCTCGSHVHLSDESCPSCGLDLYDAFDIARDPFAALKG